MSALTVHRYRTYRLDIDLPTTGEYALEIYSNDPAVDGNTYTHVCQYLLIKPNKGDNSTALLYQTPEYHDCYNVQGMREPLAPVNMNLEQLAAGMLYMLFIHSLFLTLSMYAPLSICSSIRTPPTRV